MKWFEYGDEKISDREIMIAIPSMLIGVGILSMPRDIAAATTGSDGWISLAIAGGIMVLLCWWIARLAARFPNQSFLEYTSILVTKPVAVIITFIFAVLFLSVAAFEVREISDIAKQYLFQRTPVEAIALFFLLVVVYAVSGSRAGIFRLNLMFLPIIIVIAVAVFIFNIGWFDVANLRPFFQTNISSYINSTVSSATSYLGLAIVLFYMKLVENPQQIPKKAVIGMCIPVVIYIMLYITCIGVFGNTVTANVFFPTIELAKEVDIPGGFFERFESIFFVIWIMAIFNTTVMSLDVAVLALSSIFKKRAKMHLIFILSPVVYLIAMYPKDVIDVGTFGTYLSFSFFSFTILVTLILSVLAKLRGVGS